MKRTVLICILLVTIASLSVTTSWAGTEPRVSAVLHGDSNHLRIDSFCIVEHAKYFDPSYNSKLVKPYDVSNLVSFRINESSTKVLQSAFSASITLRIYKTLHNNVIDSVDRTLTLNYDGDTTYVTRSSFRFEDAYRVKVKVLDTSSNVGWDVWQVLQVENQLEAFPVYNFTCTVDTIQTLSGAALDSNTIADQIQVSWGSVIGADEYDLEWTYIDATAYAAGVYGNPVNTALVFENNSSRVTINATEYSVPLIYDNRGYLFYRVRPVQMQNGYGRTEGKWSSMSSVGQGIFYFTGHERKLNWQATTTYAEEGKRKTVVQYFDGSLRGRQVVTRDNVNNNTIVSESFYDYQGRPVIQVLPAPSLSNIIHYARNFNINTTDSAYGKDDFDILLDPSLYCNTSAAAMKSDSGSARYYSTSNPEKNSGIHQYIPDAAGYPFTEVQYMQDNTGRISKQSGVGPTHKLGSGHETIYYYGTPDQRELDALFGTEVGDYSHYFKTMVRDANGQHSISYTDMHGRTIATALAGESPDSLDALPSNQSRAVKDVATSSSATVIKDLVMESKKGLVVSTAGDYTFSYSLNPDSLIINGCDTLPVCYDCLYDLTISITDDCNNQKLPGGIKYDTTIRNFTMGQFDTTCNAVAGFDLSFTLTLPEGSYEITKKLSVSRTAMEYYRDSVYMKKNLCKTLDDFIQEESENHDEETCEPPTCQDCLDNIVPWETFRDSFMISSGIDPADSAEYRGMALNAFIQDSLACQLLCDSTLTEYDEIRNGMLMDMVPPSGQYAKPDPSFDYFSIFHSNINGVTDTVAKYTLPTNYKDGAGNPDQVYDESAGAMVYPQQLSPEKFSQKFKLSWAESLLPYHPEFCKLQYYEQYLMASLLWDKKFSMVETYAEAKQKGYLNPTGSTFTPFTSFGSNTTNVDPIVNVTYNSPAYKDSLEQKIQYFTNDYTVNNISMWSFATALTKCVTGDSSCMVMYYSLDSAFHEATTCTADLDHAWKVFRQLYLTYKRRLINKQLNSLCPTPTVQTLVNMGHQPHFGDVSEFLSAYNISVPTTPTGAVQQAQNTMDSFYYDNCRAYATQWWNALKPCNFAASGIDSALIISILVEVCVDGSDERHPMGSSSVKPSSTNTFRSFEDVIRYYTDSVNIPYDSTCNVYLLSGPLPYGNQPALSNQEIRFIPDSCTCATIDTLYAQYQQSQYYPNETFAGWLYHTTGTLVSDGALDTLRNLCNGSYNCNFVDPPIILPPVLQCGVINVCTDCVGIDSLWNNFREEFPGIYPSLTNMDSNQLVRNQLFVNYMNQTTGFSYTAAQYIKFMYQCNLDSVAWNHCDTLYQFLFEMAISGIPCLETGVAQETISDRFNTKFGTNYSFAEVDSIMQECDIYVLNCDLYNGITTKLCGKTDPVFGPVDPNPEECIDSALFTNVIATQLYQNYKDSILNRFDSLYRARCMEAYKYETFTISYTKREYHYTLYYYDQAGNLVKTVPPEGVHPNHDSLWLDSVAAARIAGTFKVPVHTLATEYRYNTLNQVVAQKSPDGGQSSFWYDRLGRLVVSQNQKQKEASATENNRQYSYTLYDHLGRITEVGQISNATTTAMSDAISRNQGNLAAWIANSAANKGQITSTVYDVAYSGFASSFFSQRNLRNRVSYTVFSQGNNPVQFNTGSFYTYDVHGNVDTLLQDYGNSSITALKNVMNANGNRWKRIVYQYDLISGKVNHVAYQPNKSDQFYHRYSYDAENRLVFVETSQDSVHWEKDSRYQYYKHGPLARTVLGDQLVQGIDYAYTLHGWLKGVNATSLNADYDMGEDGKSGSSNQFTAKDVYSFSLNYYAGDYSAISGNIPFPGSSAYLGSAYKPLYNGNISSMSVNIGQFNAPLLNAYTYDQLNRLTGMDVFTGLDQVNNDWQNLASTKAYKERVAYDANGNILKYLRKGTAANEHMDSLTYQYNRDASGNLVNNRLNHVNDAINSTYTEDIDDQDIDNYEYDAIGNLIRDEKEGIVNIDWTVYGKIATITKTGDPAGIEQIDYTYDAAGNRISKTVNNSSGDITTTWYVRDASGNVMATYTANGTSSTLEDHTLFLKEQHLYGSSRLGILARNVDMEASFLDTASIVNLVRGLKSYELSNHLGNVLVTISDKKNGHDAGNGNYDYFEADVVTAQDYYPFGMMMVGRMYGALGRYGFNGKEQDPDVKGSGAQYDYGFRIYDPRIGRFLSEDPLTRSYPWYTPYQFSGNKPIAFLDLDGQEDKWFMVEIIMNMDNTTINYINVIDIGYNTVNNVKVPKKEGPLGPGIQFTIQIFTWVGNSTVENQLATGFLPDQPKQKNWLEEVYDYFNDLGDGESPTKAFGYRLTGGDAGGWTVDLGGKAHYSEELNIGMLLSNMSNFRDIAGAKVEISDVAEEILGPSFQVLKGPDNLSDAVDAYQESKEAKKKINAEKTSKGVSSNKKPSVDYYYDGTPAPEKKGQNGSGLRTSGADHIPDTNLHLKTKKLSSKKTNN